MKMSHRAVLATEAVAIYLLLKVNADICNCETAAVYDRTDGTFESEDPLSANSQLVSPRRNDSRSFGHCRTRQLHQCVCRVLMTALSC